MVFLIDKKETEHGIPDDGKLEALVKESKARGFETEEELVNELNRLGWIPGNMELISIPNEGERYFDRLVSEVKRLVSKLSDNGFVDIESYNEKTGTDLDYWRVDVDDNDGYPMACYLTGVSIDESGNILMNLHNYEYMEDYEGQYVDGIDDLKTIVMALTDIAEIA